MMQSDSLLYILMLDLALKKIKERLCLLNLGQWNILHLGQASLHIGFSRRHSLFWEIMIENYNTRCSFLQAELQFVFFEDNVSWLDVQACPNS